MNWMPIVEAPKVELDDLIVFNGKIVQCGQYWEGGWVDSLSDWIEPQPTHFMPLPKAPDVENSQDPK